MEIVVIIGIVVIGLIAISSGQSTSGMLDSMSNLTPTAGVQAMAQAIASAEGFYVPGSIPARAHNPGDLTQGDFGDTGTYLTSSSGAQIIVFPDDQAGWDALYRKLQNIADGNSSVYSPDMTISQLANKWTSTQQSSWADNVASTLGANLESVIGGLLA